MSPEMTYLTSENANVAVDLAPFSTSKKPPVIGACGSSVMLCESQFQKTRVKTSGRMSYLVTTSPMKISLLLA